MGQGGVVAEHPASSPHSESVPPEQVLRLAAFADGPGGGNPAGVVLDASHLTDAGMQRIATEVGYAETAFVVDPGRSANDRTVRLRYFSPRAKVPFCGHATVATAVTLAERRGVGPFAIDTPVGRVLIATSRDAAGAGDGPVTASFTSVEPALRDLDSDVAGHLLSLLGLQRADLDETWPLREAYAGNWNPIVAVREQVVSTHFASTRPR